jgi:hypothetical protein
VKRAGVVVLLVATAAAVFGMAATPAHATTATDSELAKLIANNRGASTMGSTGTPIGSSGSYITGTGVSGTGWNGLNSTSTTSAQAARTAVLDAQRASRFMPRLATLNTLTLGVGAFTLGWTIGRTLDTHVLHLSGPAGWSTAAAPSLSSIQWKHQTGTWCGTCGSIGATDGWALMVQSATHSSTDPRLWNGTSGALTNAQLDYLESGAFGPYYDNSPNCGGGVGGGATRCGVVFKTDTEMETALVPTYNGPASGAPSFTPTETRSTSYAVPGTAGNTADMTAARAALGSGTSADRWVDETTGHGTGAPPIDGTLTGPNCVGMLTSSACTAALTTLGHTGTVNVNVATTATANASMAANSVISQSWTSGTPILETGTLTITVNPAAGAMPFALPAPLYGETADDYRTRLITAGLLGTATLTTLTEDTAVPQLGRSATVRVRVGTSTLTVPVPTTTPFPSPGTAVSPWTSPTVRADSDVEIEQNPDTLPDYGAVPGSGSDDCPCPIGAIDFSPLSEISTGSTFPFGIFTFFGDILGHFNVTPEAPGWDFTLGTSAVGEYAFNWDLDAFSAYMAIVRSLISVALWIGAVWLLATRLLGFHAGGDLTEAADDGSVI